MVMFPRRHAVFRYYAELNDFLPPARRYASFAHSFELPASVKDMIESMGVPHTEVDLILVNGIPVDLSHPVQDGYRISVYPRGVWPRLPPFREELEKASQWRVLQSGSSCRGVQSIEDNDVPRQGRPVYPVADG